jgi:4-amino-4-deoxy-L-arabinose transferase-like glycosyltransferase
MRIDRRDLLALFLAALLARSAVAAFQSQPGYMDADYYTTGAQRLAAGFGFSEPFVWNYLDNPASLPRPSHLYWMPLPSLLGAASLVIFGSTYRAAQLPFVLLASIAPLIAYAIAWRVTAQRRAAWIAALLAIFSGFYLPFWGAPESFAPYAVFGSAALLLAGTARTKRAWLAAGVCAGLAHLTRADGLLLLLPMLLGTRASTDRTQERTLSAFTPHQQTPQVGAGVRVNLRPILLLLGYLAVVLPWFARNLSVAGAPISTAGAQTLWLCSYDELFSFGVTLDLHHWLGCGIDQIVAAKARALGSGLLHLVAENGLVFLAPLMAAGLWRLRRDRLFRPALLYLVLLYLAMTLAFTFIGERGGLFHSSAALLPFLCAAAPVGLEAIVGAIAKRRSSWQVESALRFFAFGVVALAALFSAAIVWSRVIGSDWNRAGAAYRDAGTWLAKLGDAGSIVVAGNPPGFTYHTGRPSIVVPNGDADTLIAAARRFGAKWLVLDANRPAPLAALYADPSSDPRFTLAATFDGTYLFKIDAR